MEQSKKKKLIIITYKLMTALTAVCAAMLFLAFLTAFDADKGYFNKSNPLPELFQATFIATVMGSVGCASLLDKNEVLTPTNKVAEKSKTNHALVGISLVLLGTFGFYIDMGVAFSGDQTYFLGIGASALGVYYLLIALKESYSRSALKFACIFISLALPIGIIIQSNSYFGRSLNSVENTLSSVFTVSYLFYIIYEGKRLDHGEEGRGRFASLLLIRASSLTYSCAYILAYVVGAVNEGGRFYQMLPILLIGVISDIALRTFIQNATREHAHEEEKAEAEPYTESETDVLEVQKEDADTDTEHFEESESEDILGEGDNDDASDTKIEAETETYAEAEEETVSSAAVSTDDI